MENRCLQCSKVFTDEIRRHYCQQCSDYLNSLEFDSKPMFIIKSSVNGGNNLSKAEIQRMKSRVIDDEGNTLSGKAGLDYMKKNPDKYANRLKDYHNLKD